MNITINRVTYTIPTESELMFFIFAIYQPNSDFIEILETYRLIPFEEVA